MIVEVVNRPSPAEKLIMELPIRIFTFEGATEVFHPPAPVRVRREAKLKRDHVEDPAELDVLHSVPRIVGGIEEVLTPNHRFLRDMATEIAWLITL